MTTLKIGIATYEEMRARTLAIASGDLAPKAEDPKVWFTSPERFAKLLSNKNRALLAAISEQHPVSISAIGEELAVLGRKLGLTDEDFVMFEQVRDKKPAEPLRFE